MAANNADSIQQFQELQQQYQSVIFQKETTSLQLQEMESALKELESAKGDAFRAVGMILVKKDASTLKSELLEQKETLHVRLKSLQKQEKMLADRLLELQRKLVQSQAARQENAGAE